MCLLYLAEYRFGKKIGVVKTNVINLLVIKLHLWFSPPRSQILIFSLLLTIHNQVFTNRIPKTMIYTKNNSKCVKSTDTKNVDVPFERTLKNCFKWVDLVKNLRQLNLCLKRLISSKCVATELTICH